MATITVHLSQINEATTEGRVRDHKVLIDRPVVKGGNDLGAMGGELLLLSLGGCFNSNLLAAIRARELEIADIAIEVNGNLIENPPRFDAIEMVVSSAYEDREQLQKLVTISERSCIVANSLRNGLKLTVRLGG